jgi:hypothetical protein
MAFTRKPVVDNAAEEAAEMAPPPPRTAPKKKGKMPAPGASKPGWKKIATQMMECKPK